MYLITYGGRTVIHDGSVEGPRATTDWDGHDKAMKLSYEHAVNDGPNSKRALGLPPSLEGPRGHGGDVDV